MSSLKGEVMADEKVEKSIVSVPVEIEELNHYALKVHRLSVTD